jgi:hypothetical protein
MFFLKDKVTLTTKTAKSLIKEFSCLAANFPDSLQQCHQFLITLSYDSRAKQMAALMNGVIH